MKIYRHCFSNAELHSGDPAPLIDTFNSLGFVQRDGSKIEWTLDPSSNYYQDFLIRYKLDTKNKVYGLLPVRIRAGGTDGSRADQVYIHLSNNGNYYPFSGASYKGWIYYTYPVHLIFIPLKNNGFYLNVAQDGHNELIDCSYTTLPILHPLGQRDYNEGSFCANFIGLPPSGNQTDWTYLTFANFYYVPSYSSPTRAGGHNVVDFGSSNTTNCPFFSNIDSYDTLYNVKQYININQNICSLIRMPYNTNFVNNLYLLATAPMQVKPGTFFSFGGRNFLNVIANYVVELPSD